MADSWAKILPQELKLFANIHELLFLTCPWILCRNVISLIRIVTAVEPHLHDATVVCIMTASIEAFSPTHPTQMEVQCFYINFFQPRPPIIMPRPSLIKSMSWYFLSPYASAYSDGLLLGTWKAKVNEDTGKVFKSELSFARVRTVSIGGVVPAHVCTYVT